MAHHNTVFVQLLRFLPRHEFEAEARQHQRGQGLRVMSRWAQFVALGLAQLTGRQSLRDIVSNLSTQGRKLYHLGVGTTVSRSSLARVNAEQPYTLYETLFGRLLSRCRQCAPRHSFRFKNKLYAVDATTIDLCLAVFPWASFRRTKAAIKLHVGLDQAGHLPSFVSVTEGKTGDVKVARTWTFPAGSVVVADRAYLDFKWFHQLQARGVTFVTRLKRGVRYRVTREHDVRPGTGVLSDQTIELTSARSRKAYAAPLRRVAYQDPVTKNRYVFVTNNTTWEAGRVDALDRADELELGDLVDEVEVVEALDAVEVSLVDRIDPQVVGLSEGLGPAPLADGDVHGAGRRGHRPAAALIAGRVAQVVEVSVGDGGEALEAAVAEQLPGPDAELARGRTGEGAVEGIDFGEQPDVGLGVAAWEGVPGAAAVGDGSCGPVLVQQAGDLRA